MLSAFGVIVSTGLSPTMVKLVPSVDRPTLNLSCGGEASAWKLHEVITPSDGAAYCPLGETD